LVVPKQEARLTGEMKPGFRIQRGNFALTLYQRGNEE
jgi:hypothetical protein